VRVKLDLALGMIRLLGLDADQMSRLAVSGRSAFGEALDLGRDVLGIVP
jgi:hypothetical protein